MKSKKTKEPGETGPRQLVANEDEKMCYFIIQHVNKDTVMPHHL